MPIHYIKCCTSDCNGGDELVPITIAFATLVRNFPALTIDKRGYNSICRLSCILPVYLLSEAACWKRSQWMSQQHAFMSNKQRARHTIMQGYRVWIFRILRSFGMLDAKLTSFRRKSLSQPALFSLPRIDCFLAVGVTRARFSASFRISARFSGPLFFRLRRLSSPMVTSKTQCREFSIYPLYYSFSNQLLRLLS